MPEVNEQQPMPTSPEGVRDLLADTIGTDVFNAMEKIDPIHDVGNMPRQGDPAQAPVTPAAPATTTQGDPAPVASPAAQPQAHPEGAPAVEGQPGIERLILGKFKTEAEAEKAHHLLIHANKTLMAELDALKGKSSVATPTSVTPTATPSTETRISPLDISKMRAAPALAKFKEVYGVEPEDFVPLVQQLAEDIIEQREAPKVAFAAADSYMAERYPESIAMRDELVQFMTTDADTKPFVEKTWARGDYKEALEYGWTKMRGALAQGTENKMVLNAEIRKQEVDAARKDAGLVTTQASGVHETKQIGPSQGDMETLTAMSRAGNPYPLLRATIGKTLPDELFGVNS